MKIADAALLLAVDLDGLTNEAVNASYAATIKYLHPDTGIGDTVGLDMAKKARDTLREFVSMGGKHSCPRCNGRGTERGAFGGQVRCTACQGRG